MMVVGILQFDLHIRGAESLKDKRRVVQSVKDRLHREHQVSVAEVDLNDIMNVARLGLAAVGNDGAHIGRVLDSICAELRALHDADLGDTFREVLHGSAIFTRGEGDMDVDEVNEEMLRRMSDFIQEKKP
jgi:uncharacterized protein YlxP (DUF503 family)